MGDIIIKVDWVFFLGLIGSLIAFAWYSSARFTALETSMSWVKDTLHDLKVSLDNTSGTTPVFLSRSPVNLTPTGELWLIESGWKDYIDTNKTNLMDICNHKRETNPYEVQKHIFKYFDMMELPEELDNTLKEFAYKKGSTMGVVRRVGAIYFRNICLQEFGMERDDIDKHDPEKITI